MTRPTDRAWLTGLTIFALATTVFRFWFASTVELAPDEAYYWTWSRNLNLSYSDHPPLVAWLIHLGVWLAGNSALGVRLINILMSSLAVIVSYLCAREVGLRTPHASIAAALTTLLPMPATGSIITTPDTPLGLAWLLVLFFLLRRTNRRSSPCCWYLIGAAGGAALLAKHTAFMIPVFIGVAAIGSAEIKRDMRTPHPWLAALLGGVIALPYFVAEARAGFPAVSFQLAHLGGQLGTATGGPLAVMARIPELIAGQFGLLTPFVAGWLVYASTKSKKDPKLFILSAGFMVPFLATLISALFTHPEQNWASLGHPAAAIAAFVAIQTISKTEERVSFVKRRLWMATLLFTVFVSTAIIHIHTALPFLPLPPHRDPVSRLHGWSELAAISEYTDRFDAIVCDHYGLAAQAAWQLRNHAPHIPVSSTDRPALPPPGSHWLLLEETAEWGDAELAVACAQTRPVAAITLRLPDGRAVREISILEGTSCRLTAATTSRQHLENGIVPPKNTNFACTATVGAARVPHHIPGHQRPKRSMKVIADATNSPL